MEQEKKQATPEKKIVEEDVRQEQEGIDNEDFDVGGESGVSISNEG